MIDWLDWTNVDFIFIPGYCFVYSCRTNGVGGGVGLFIREDIVFKAFEPACGTSAHVTYESLFVTFPQTEELTVLLV